MVLPNPLATGRLGLLGEGLIPSDSVRIPPTPKGPAQGPLDGPSPGSPGPLGASWHGGDQAETSPGEEAEEANAEAESVDWTGGRAAAESPGGVHADTAGADAAAQQGETSDRLGERGSRDSGAAGALPPALLDRLSAGDPEASSEVFNLLYEQLHAHATRLMRGQRPGHTLQATALVGEAYLRLFGDVPRVSELRAKAGEQADQVPSDQVPSDQVPSDQVPSPERRAINGREHFIAMAAKAMRWVLIDHARAKLRIKRGRNAKTVPLDQVLLTYEARDFDLLALDEALNELAQSEPELAQVVELRFFAGLPMEEIAPIVGMTLRTLERKWHFAKVWLYDRMA
jgi:DNA-directed RNA polymerase specialized sigma24 family protein